MNYKIRARQQKTEESELKEKDEMEGTRGRVEVPGASNSIYEVLLEGKCFCYLVPFAAPTTDFSPFPLHSILQFFTFNLHRPNGSITHVRLPPQDVYEGRGCVKAAG